MSRFSFCATCREEYENTPKGAHNPSLLLLPFCYHEHNFVLGTPDIPGYHLCDGRKQILLEDVSDDVWAKIDTWLDKDNDDILRLFDLLCLAPMFRKERDDICSGGLLSLIAHIKEKESGMHTLNYFIYCLRRIGFSEKIENEILSNAKI